MELFTKCISVDKPSVLPTAYPYLVIPLTMQNEIKTTFQNGLRILSEIPMQKAYYT